MDEEDGGGARSHSANSAITARSGLEVKRSQVAGRRSSVELRLWLSSIVGAIQGP
jgi:hypothetical protein